MTPDEIYQRALQERQQADLGGVEGIPNDIQLQRTPGRIEPAPYQPIDPAQRYELQPIGQPDLDPSGLAGWAESPEQGGLGVAGRGPLPSPQAGLTEHFAQQLFPDFKGKLSILDKIRLNQGMAAAIPNMAAQRQSMAVQLAQLEETKRQNQWEDVFKVLGNDKLAPPQAVEILKGMAKQNPEAARAAQTVNDRMLGEFHTWQTYLPRKPEEYMQGLQSGQITWPQVAAEVDAAKTQGMEETKAMAKETAQQRKTQGLLTKFQQDPNALTDTELDLVDQHFKQKQERALKIQQLQLGNRGAQVDLAKKETAPSQVYHGIEGPQGESVTGIYDPRTGQTTQMRGTPIQRVQTDEPKFTPEQAARVSAMNQTLNNLMDLRTALVPDGKKVDRGVLFTSVFGGLPFTGGRDVERYIEDAIETKLRLQTGAAANRDEVVKEAKKFKPSQLDTDETIIGKFDKLERYMQDTFNVLDPMGVVRARLGAAGGNIGQPPVPFDQAYEDLKKKRPTWSNTDIFRELQRRGVQP